MPFCNTCIDTPCKHVPPNFLAHNHSQLQWAEALRQLSAHCQWGCFPENQLPEGAEMPGFLILCAVWILPTQALRSWWGETTPKGAAAPTHSVMTDSCQHLMRALVGKPWRASTHFNHAVWFLNSARFGIKLSYTGKRVDEERSTCKWRQQCSSTDHWQLQQHRFRADWPLWQMEQPTLKSTPQQLHQYHAWSSHIIAHPHLCSFRKHQRGQMQGNTEYLFFMLLPFAPSSSSGVDKMYQ